MGHDLTADWSLPISFAGSGHALIMQLAITIMAITFFTRLCNKRNTNSSVFSERELKFMFAICHRPSVCLSSVVCNVGAPYSGD